MTKAQAMKDVTPKKTGKPAAAARPAPSRALARPQAKPPAAVPAPTNFIAVIAQAAADPRTDVTKMQALLDMQRQIEDREAAKQFTTSFIKLQNALPSINRDGKIEIKAKDGSGERNGRVQQSTPYASFNAIHKTIKPLLVEHGFALSFSTEPTTDGRLMVKTILDHIGGHQRTTSFPLPAETSGSKNNVQGWGSSQSYGKRYGTIALLNIVTHAPEDIDTDGHNVPVKRSADSNTLVQTDEPDQQQAGTGIALISDKQAMDMRDLIEWCGVPVAKFCGHFTIKTVADLPADKFGAAKKACEDFKANSDRKAATNG